MCVHLFFVGSGAMFISSSVNALEALHLHLHLLSIALWNVKWIVGVDHWNGAREGVIMSVV